LATSIFKQLILKKWKNEHFAVEKELDVYAFTWSDGEGRPSWTPLMLRLRDLYIEEFDTPIDQDRKQLILSQLKLKEPAPDSPDFIEFLYLNSNQGWKWGKNGMTNAVFLHGEARNYFRQFF